MSALDNPITVAVIDRNKDRCTAIAGALAAGGNAKIFVWYIDPEPVWQPTVPDTGSLQMVICHYGVSERELLETIPNPSVVFFGGGGGAEISHEYVIRREITGTRNAISASEGQELLEFFRLDPEQRTPERVPGLLRPGFQFFLLSLAVVCQAFLTLDRRLNDRDETADRYIALLPDRGFCETQLERLKSPAWWHSVFGAPLPLDQIKEKEWNTSRGDFEKVVEFDQCLAQAEPLKRATVEALYGALTQQLRL